MNLVEVQGLEGYTASSLEPLKVTAWLDTGVPIIAYDMPALDSLLTWALVHEATKGQLLSGLEPGQAYKLPAPFGLVAECEGLPIWASTKLLPMGIQGMDTIVECKREQTGRWTKTKTGTLNIDAAAGRWRARMIPRPGILVERLEAHCMGDRREIERLLRKCSHLGKRRAVGYGLVRRWTVEPAEAWSIVRAGVLTRPLPLQALQQLGLKSESSTFLLAWTPAYWVRSLWREGLDTGTPAEACAS